MNKLTMNTWFAFVSCKHHRHVNNGPSQRFEEQPTFNPTPPALRLMMSTLGSREGALKPATASLRFLMSIVPSNRYHGNSSRASTT